MDIKRAAPVNELLARLIFLILPTAAVSYFLLQNVNTYYSILQNQAFQQACYFAVGMAAAAVFYSFRFRFLFTYLLLLLAFYGIYKGLDGYQTGEMDTYFVTVRFLVFAILFCAGWLAGWGFQRLRYWAVGMAVALLTACIALIAKSNIVSVNGLLWSFLPALLYAVYVVFTAEQIYNYHDKSKKFWWFLTRRLLFFALLATLIMGTVVLLMRASIKETVDNFGGGGKAGANSMTKQNKDNKFDITQYMGLRSTLSQSQELLFCAHIDNFFPGTEIPNPLYLTAFYFTKFDTLTETFERDSTIPYNDLFQPDPSKVPLYYTQVDSSVIPNSLGEKLRSTVNVEIYLKKLSPSTYLAPNVGYFVQPIAVEKDFRTEFSSAYRAKSYTSLLNSAYFVYNAPNKQLRDFQEKRFEVLRKVTDYKGVDSDFMTYYTRMPRGDKYQTIVDLAHKITDTAVTPVDKVIAIRNYFYSRDENGDRVYKYTDNPGVPDLPNASKLLYFLNENHKGYCAYYAGATLFLLRALGIPSRIAVGFLTEDRSDKNKGWYWYYANQAHAWVQVYFPGYGWLDFDTTVGNENEETHQTPQSDGTPPMQPPVAWFAADGVVEDVDTVLKKIHMRVKQFVFHDVEYKLKAATDIEMDVHIATMYKDSVAIPLSKVMKGDEGTAVSYAEVLKNLQVAQGTAAEAVLDKIPDPAPVDEVYLKRKDTAQKKEEQIVPPTPKPVSAKFVAEVAAGLVCCIILLSILLPSVIYRLYRMRYRSAKTDGDRTYWAFRTTMFYLHMCGIPRGQLTPLQYARDVVDRGFGTNFTGFMNIYLKKKYAKQPLTAAETKQVSEYVAPFIATVSDKVTRRKRFFWFMNPVRCAGFYVMPEDD